MCCCKREKGALQLAVVGFDCQCASTSVYSRDLERRSTSSPLAILKDEYGEASRRPSARRENAA